MAVSLYHPQYEELRNMLRQKRLEAGLTQNEMAQLLNVGQSYVSKLERGENFVDVLLFARWCEACGIEPGATLTDLCKPKIQPVRGRR